MGEIKQIIVMRKDLHCRAGKIAAQVAHASMKVILDMMSKERVSGGMQKWSLLMHEEDDIFTWLDGQFTKIVLYVPDLDYMMNLKDRAEMFGVPTALIIDAGKTEFHNKPTPTALALGPADSDVLGELTGDLKLI